MRLITTILLSLIFTSLPLKAWASCSSMVICGPVENKGNHLSICQGPDRKEILQIHGRHEKIPSPGHGFHKAEMETITTRPAVVTGDGGSVSFYNQDESRPVFVTEENTPFGRMEGLDTKFLKEVITPTFMSAVGDFYLKFHFIETGKYEYLMFTDCQIFSQLP